jgi:hypothetical protein
VPVAEIVRALNPLLDEHGVILRERVLEVIRETDEAIKATPNGDPIYDGRVPTIRVKVLAKIEWTWIHDRRRLRATIVNYGEAHDVADKAIRKANTAAYKEMLLRTFASSPARRTPTRSTRTRSRRRCRSAATAASRRSTTPGRPRDARGPRHPEGPGARA